MAVVISYVPGMQEISTAMQMSQYSLDCFFSSRQKIMLKFTGFADFNVSFPLLSMVLSVPSGKQNSETIKWSTSRVERFQTRFRLGPDFDYQTFSAETELCVL